MLIKGSPEWNTDIAIDNNETLDFNVGMLSGPTRPIFSSAIHRN